MAREFPEIIPPGHVDEVAAPTAAEGGAAAAAAAGSDGVEGDRGQGGAGGAVEIPGADMTGPDSAAHVLLEVGCGVGNAVFPMLEDYPGLFVYCCDFSPRAVGLVQANEDYDTARCKAFQCDLTSDDLTANVPPGSIDCVTMLFMLSAISPEKFAASIANVAKVLKPGGGLCCSGITDCTTMRW